MDALEKSTPSSFLEAMEALLKWIADFGEVLNSEPFCVNELEILEEQYSQYKVRYLSLRI